MYAHDYADLYFRDWNINPINIKPGTPMKVTIRDKEFYGYVHDIRNEQGNNKNFTKVGFVGASFVMKQASQKIYRNLSADQIIAEIAKKYNFAYKVVPHPRVYSQVSQAGLTDWQFMVYLARECGYFLRAENTEIHFKPFTEDFIRLINESPSFQKADGGFKPVNPIYSFKPTLSETLDVFGFKKSANSIAGVNPVDGSYFKVAKQDNSITNRVYSNPELFDRHSTLTVANDYSTAVHLANAADERSRFPYSARVKTIGSEKLRPCMPVYLNNVGAEYSGYWTLLAVEHHIVEEELNHPMYTCEFTVASDSLGHSVDSKIPTTPPLAKTVRTVVPNQINRNIKPKTVIYRPSIVAGRNRPIEIVDRINLRNQSGPFVATARWGSTHRDLTYKVTDERMPQAVWLKVRSNGTLR